MKIPILKEFEWFEWFEWFDPSPIEPFNPGVDGAGPGIAPEPPQGVAGPRKKGIGVSLHAHADWYQIVASVRPFWSYNWGLTLSELQPSGVEFAPMKWSGSLSQPDADTLKAEVKKGKVAYLLGYNEPDNKAQANMPVERAVALWPQLEAVGVLGCK